MNTESISDFFSRTTGKHFTLNLGEDVQLNFGTEYIYADTETTATNKIGLQQQLTVSRVIMLFGVGRPIIGI